MEIEIVPLSPGSPVPLRLLAGDLSSLLRMPVTCARCGVSSEGVLDVSRMQYHSGGMLELLLEHAGDGASKILGVTSQDLFLPVLTFVFGQAQVNNRAAVFSTFRLRNEFYGLPADPDLLYQRAFKEGLHELGHTFGLRHCREHPCVMNSSTYVEDIDLKPAVYCPPCLATINLHVRQ
jgi:archaemetzincin